MGYFAGGFDKGRVKITITSAQTRLSEELASGILRGIFYENLRNILHIQTDAIYHRIAHPAHVAVFKNELEATTTIAVRDRIKSLHVIEVAFHRF